MQVFSAIYKRIFRSLREEYAKMYRLNSQYLNEETYFTVLDEQEEIGPEDYTEGDFDIVPVADPNVVTNMQRLGRAQFLMQFIGDPNFNAVEIRKRMLEAASIDDIDKILIEETPPDPNVAQMADEMDMKKRELMLRETELQSEIMKRQAETAADSVLHGPDDGTKQAGRDNDERSPEWQ